MANSQFVSELGAASEIIATRKLHWALHDATGAPRCKVAVAGLLQVVSACKTAQQSEWLSACSVAADSKSGAFDPGAASLAVNLPALPPLALNLRRRERSD